jgi:transcriptional regulator with XRE-family HTH domain
MPVKVLDGKLDGRAIQIGRALRGWNQRDLALASDLKVRCVWEIENNMRPPTRTELARILGALSTGG